MHILAMQCNNTITKSHTICKIYCFWCKSVCMNTLSKQAKNNKTLLTRQKHVLSMQNALVLYCCFVLSRVRFFFFIVLTQ